MKSKTSKELKDFYLLWSTQSLSQLGSAMTGFALTLWMYEKTGSALSTAALTICTYAPYVLMSIREEYSPAETRCNFLPSRSGWRLAVFWWIKSVNRSCPGREQIQYIPCSSEAEKAQVRR